VKDYASQNAIKGNKLSLKEIHQILQEKKPKTTEHLKNLEFEK